jgi:hypothetical protein
MTGAGGVGDFAGANAGAEGATENCAVEKAGLFCRGTAAAGPTEWGKEGVGEVTCSTGCNRCDAIVAGDTAVVDLPSSRIGDVGRGVTLPAVDVTRPPGSSLSSSSESGCMLRVEASSSAATGDVPPEEICGPGCVACCGEERSATTACAGAKGVAPPGCGAEITGFTGTGGDVSPSTVRDRRPIVLVESALWPSEALIDRKGRSDSSVSARCQFTRSLLMRSSPATCPCMTSRWSATISAASMVTPVVGRSAYQATD